MLKFFISIAFAVGVVFPGSIDVEALDEKPLVLEVPRKANIPVQIPLKDEEKYATFRQKAESYLSGGETNECAKFVNRMFLVRFGKLMFGNAWDLQLNEENRKFIKLLWRLKETDFNRENDLRLYNYQDRGNHFRQLYSIIEVQKHPIGVIGFMYRYSFYRDQIVAFENVIPQSHIAFLAGKKKFFFENISNSPKYLEEVINEKYGEMHDYEKDFVWKRVPLRKILAPGEKHYYDDYLIEEQFKKVKAESLLEVFLRKHRNNRITPLFRPVSFSRISDELIEEIELQKGY